MTPFEVYQMYVALKNHFTQKNYDYFKYGGKVKVKPETFETRKDKYFFYKLSKRKDVRDFLLANLVDGSKDFWIGEVREHMPEEIYLRWRKRKESLSYIYTQDLTNMKEEFDENFKVPEYGHPYLLRLFLRQDVCIETLIILDMLVGYSKLWNRKLQKDLIWNEVYTKMIKYRPFLSINIDKFKKVTINTFTL